MPHKARIAYFPAESNPELDEPVYFLKPIEAQRRVDAGYVVWIGESSVQQRGEVRTMLDKLTNWNFGRAFSGAMRDCALNRGRGEREHGHFTTYPVPYCYEGEMKPMRVAIVNRDPGKFATELECAT